MRKQALICTFILLGCAQPVDSIEPADNVGMLDESLKLLCDDSNECTKDVVLASGQCFHFNYTNLQSCARGEGHCNGNVSPAQCCLGCMMFVDEKVVCRASCPLWQACGPDGFCAGAFAQAESSEKSTPDAASLGLLCDDGNACTKDVLTSKGRCTHATLTDTPCNVCDIAGVCVDGSCVQTQQGPAHCPCETWKDCPAPTPCHGPACVAGVCQLKPVPDGNLCDGGLCVDGTCVGTCSAASDCPASPACQERRCDPSGARTSPGLPTGCYMEPSPPGTACSFTKGEYTCPGNCSGSAPDFDCESLEPHCGGY